MLFQLKEQIESNQTEFGAMQGAWIETSTSCDDSFRIHDCWVDSTFNAVSITRNYYTHIDRMSVSAIHLIPHRDYVTLYRKAFILDFVFTDIPVGTERNELQYCIYLSKIQTKPLIIFNMSSMWRKRKFNKTLHFPFSIFHIALGLKGNASEIRFAVLSIPRKVGILASSIVEDRRLIMICFSM